VELVVVESAVVLEAAVTAEAVGTMAVESAPAMPVDAAV
jgi:hypothetical protein